VEEKEMAATKKAKAPAAEIVKVRLPQVRILDALKDGQSRSRREIQEASGVSAASCTEFIGSPDDDMRKANDERYGFKSLVTLGYVSQERTDVDGKDVMLATITKLGRQALTAAMEWADLTPRSEKPPKEKPEPKSKKDKEEAPAKATKGSKTNPDKGKGKKPVKTTKPVKVAAEEDPEATSEE
jgi:hypothetical protein